MTPSTCARSALRLSAAVLASTALVIGASPAASAAQVAPFSITVAAVPVAPTDSVGTTDTGDQAPSDGVEPETVTSPDPDTETSAAPETGTEPETGADAGQEEVRDSTPPGEPGKAASPKPEHVDSGSGSGNGGLDAPVDNGGTANQETQQNAPDRQAPTVAYDPGTGFPLDPATGYAVHPRTGLLIVPTTGAMVVRGSLAPSNFVYDFDARLVKLAPEESASDTPEPSASTSSATATASADESTLESPSSSPDPTPSEVASESPQSGETSPQATEPVTESGMSQPVLNALVGVAVVLIGLWYFFVVFRRPQRKVRGK